MEYEISLVAGVMLMFTLSMHPDKNYRRIKIRQGFKKLEEGKRGGIGDV